jgi:hypothetical protein
MFALAHNFVDPSSFNIQGCVSISDRRSRKIALMKANNSPDLLSPKMSSEKAVLRWFKSWTSAERVRHGKLLPFWALIFHLNGGIVTQRKQCSPTPKEGTLIAY